MILIMVKTKPNDMKANLKKKKINIQINKYLHIQHIYIYNNNKIFYFMIEVPLFFLFCYIDFF